MPEVVAHRIALVALIVAVAVSSVGALYAFSGPPIGNGAEGPFLLVLAGAILASCRPVRIARLRIDLVPFHPFLLTALVLFGIRSAALIGVVSIITAASLRNELPPAIRVVFNLGATTLATVAAGLTLQLFGVPAGSGAARLVVPLTASAVVFFLVKTALIAAAICFEVGQGYLATWRRSLRWTAVSDLAGIPVALATLATLAVSPVAALAIALAPCWLLWLYYRTTALRKASAPS